MVFELYVELILDYVEIISSSKRENLIELICSDGTEHEEVKEASAVSLTLKYVNAIPT